MPMSSMRSDHEGCGDPVSTSSSHLILNSVGAETLHDIVSEHLQLLETSAAVYERNGDYADEILTSGWCRTMSAASRKLCNTDDDRVAASCGKWHCHHSCWNDTASRAIAEERPVDLPCAGGLRLLAVPIVASGKVVGAISAGYGNPPLDTDSLTALARKFEVNVEDLTIQARGYVPRPPEIVELAKKRLVIAARLIGEMVSRAQIERQYHMLFHSMLDGFALHEVILDENDTVADYRFLDVNPAFEKLTGLTARQLIGKTVLEVLPRTESYWLETYGQVALTGVPIHFEQYSAEIGRHFLVSAFRPREGQFACIFHDLSDRKLAETKLKEQVNELTRWHDVTLGREMRVIELKHEVNQLLAAASAPPRYHMVAETDSLRSIPDE